KKFNSFYIPITVTSLPSSSPPGLTILNPHPHSLLQEGIYLKIIFQCKIEKIMEKIEKDEVYTFPDVQKTVTSPNRLQMREDGYVKEWMLDRYLLIIECNLIAERANLTS
ncbi:hypothetical protein STEG23_016807, partial [Scotinomys teguina]